MVGSAASIAEQLVERRFDMTFVPTLEAYVEEQVVPPPPFHGSAAGKQEQACVLELGWRCGSPGVWAAGVGGR